MKDQEVSDAELGKIMKEAIAFFERTELPAAIQLSAHEVIVDVKKFIDAHIGYLRSYWLNKSLRSPFLIRFLIVYDLILTNKYEQPDIKAFAKPSAASLESKKKSSKAPTKRRK